MDVFFSDTDTKPAAATLTASVDLAAVFGDDTNLYFGFTAGTGGATGTHEVLSFSLKSSSLAGDLTRNGFVDFEDLTLLLANWNQQVGVDEGNLVDADTTVVNFADLTVLLANWTGPGGAASPEAALAAEAVPEPSSMLLAVMAAIGILVFRRRRCVAVSCASS